VRVDAEELLVGHDDVVVDAANGVGLFDPRPARTPCCILPPNERNLTATTTKTPFLESGEELLRYCIVMMVPAQRTEAIMLR